MNRALGQRARVLGAVARALAAGYRNRDEARVFIAEALDDRIAREGLSGAVRVAGLCVKDIIVSQWRPDGYAITAAPISTSGRAAAFQRNTLMDRMMQDVRFGLRQIRRNPGFALVAILTMALGIGANTAIFNVAWRTMLQPLPYAKSEQLVEIWETFGGPDKINYSMPAKFHDVRRGARSFQYVAAFSALKSPVDLTGGGDPEQLLVRRVSGDYFNVFAMAPILGRVLGSEDVNNGTSAAVISEGLWRRRFNAGAVLGATVTLTGSPSTIVGVMPAAFEISGGRVDVWTPLMLPPETNRTSAHYLRVVARLADNVTIGEADAEVKIIAARAAQAHPEFEGKLSQMVTSLTDGRGTPRGDAALKSGLLTLSLAALVVLLIACANLASLQLARAVSRAREFGIRAALGASRGRMIAQLLTEGLIIAVSGAAVGLVAGTWILQQLSNSAPPYIRVAIAAGPDRIVIAFAAMLGLVSGCVFALAPAWRAAGGATRWLRQRAEGGDRGSAYMRLGLVTGQIAAAMILLVGAVLLMTSLANLMRVDPGFNPDGALAFDVSVPGRYDSYEKRAQLFQSIGDRLAALPGVSSVCAINTIPFDSQFNMTYVPEGRTNAQSVNAIPRTMTAGCVETLGLTLTKGRNIDPNDTHNVAIVSAAFARAAWPDANPLGQRVHLGVADGPLIEVVGVTNDVLGGSLESRSTPQFFQAWTAGAPQGFGPTHVIVRTAAEPASLFASVRAAVRAIDPDQPVAQLRTMRQVVANTTSARRFDLTLLGSFAAVALVLATIGVYGLLSQIVAQRTSEIGLRLALGATPTSVVRLMLRQAGVALALGVPVGIGGAVLASQLLQRFMFGLSATEPRAYLTVAAVLTLIVFSAAWLPARRAARVDPALTLK